MFSSSQPQALDQLLNGLLMMANSAAGLTPGQRQLTVPPQPAVQQAPLQRPVQTQAQNQAGFCYSCNTNAIITSQNTCRYCASGFVEVFETTPVTAPAPAPANNPPAARPPPTLVASQAAAPPPVHPVAAPVRQKRTYTRRNQVTQPAPSTQTIQTTGQTSASAATLTTTQPQVTAKQSPSKTSRPRVSSFTTAETPLTELSILTLLNRSDS